jgi:hypothetical protein
VGRVHGGGKRREEGVEDGQRNADRIRKHGRQSGRHGRRKRAHGVSCKRQAAGGRGRTKQLCYVWLDCSCQKSCCEL